MGIKDLISKRRNGKELKAEFEKLEEFRKSPQCHTQDDPVLHVACQYHYSDDLIINHLIKSDEKALRVENKDGELALHVAMKDVHELENGEGGGAKGVSGKVLDTMIALNDSALKHLDAKNCLPIHLACEYGASDSTIQKLLKAYPEATMTTCGITKPIKNVYCMNNNVVEVDGSSEGGGSSIGILSCCGIGDIFSASTDDNTMNEVTFETDFSPLHLAVLNNASPNAIDYIINANPCCLNLVTSRGRKAIDVALSLTSLNPDVLQLLESYSNNAKKVGSLRTRSDGIIRGRRAAANNNNSNKNTDHSDETHFDAKVLWKASVNAVIFANRLAAALGPSLAMDGVDTVNAPIGFEEPIPLEYSCVDVKLPIGFRQLRWALLNSKSGFNKEFHEQEMKYTE